MIQNPNAIGAAPAMGNPQMGQTPKLSPEQIAALKKDPEVLEVVKIFMGRPTPIDHLPDNVIAELAGAVNKLGVQGAVQMLEQKLPPDIKQKIKSAV